MYTVIDPDIAEYLSHWMRHRDPLLDEMESYARENDFPIIGPLAGAYLYQLACMSNAKRVFELGSGYGYSAYYFLKAVGPTGMVHCTELSEKNIDLARDFLTRADLWDRVTFHQEDALSALERIGGSWDVIFNDIHKHQYPASIELAYHHLRPGGLFISDNVLWSGRVLDGKDDGSPDTAAIKEFTRPKGSSRLFFQYGTVLPSPCGARPRGSFVRSTGETLSFYSQIAFGNDILAAYVWLHSSS
ncbi:MAG: O-methyltransferase [Chlorobi bacterium]|nr:O-methyltransferase [Chlorobiota bacterium]